MDVKHGKVLSQQKSAEVDRSQQKLAEISSRQQESTVVSTSQHIVNSNRSSVHGMQADYRGPTHVLEHKGFGSLRDVFLP